MDSKLRDEIVKTLAVQSVTDGYICDKTKAIADSILSLLAPELDKARKWDIYQQERALDDAEKDRFVKLMQADEDKLRRDAEQWRKVKEIADSRPPCKCPLWDTETAECTSEHAGCVFRDVVDALTEKEAT